MGRRGFLDYLRNLWMVRGFTFQFQTDITETGYRKPIMKFKRPVKDQFPVSAPFGEWGALWSKHMTDSGTWVDGQVNGKGQHKGIDFAVPVGTEIVAMYDGLIVKAGWENVSNIKQGFGLRVRHQIIDEGHVPLTLVYGHMSLLHVQEGHQIHKGDRIGLSGKTGHVSGPHLHVELVDGKGQYRPIEFESPPPAPLVNPPQTA